MVNNRDDSTGQEESEYHFSEEEGNYEDMEAETPKPAAVAVSPKERFLNSLSRSKRMLISLCVFLVLVFVVYKIVAPNSSAPTTDIAPIVQPTPTPSNTVKTREALPPQIAAPNTIPVSPPPSTLRPEPPLQPAAAPLGQAPAVAQTAQLVPSNQPVLAPVSAPSSQPVTVGPYPPANNERLVSGESRPIAPPPSMGAPDTAMDRAPSMGMVPTQPVAVPRVEAPQEAVSQPQYPPVSPATQAAMGVPSAVPTALPSNASVAAEAPSSLSPLAALSANNDRLIAQLQADSAQRLSQFSAQTKQVQDQVKALNARVATMEAQLRQLVQVLTHEGGDQRSAPPAAVASPATRVPFNVQAIIPGRAWLRSDSGETITVTEGDMLKGFGRVTKIDPYDGIVEINTGNKILSISYGSGG